MQNENKPVRADTISANMLVKATTNVSKYETAFVKWVKGALKDASIRGIWVTRKPAVKPFVVFPTPSLFQENVVLLPLWQDFYAK